MSFITKVNLSSHCAFGSQMAQYASLYAIGKKTGLEPLFIKETLNNTFGFPLDIPFIHKPKTISISDIKGNMMPISINLSKGESIDKNLFLLSPNYNYYTEDDLGMYQHFHDIRDDILKLYNFNEEIKQYCDGKIIEMKQKNEILVSVCFRRGDYLTNASLNLSLEYYYQAMKTIEQLIPDQTIKYIIFSGCAYGDDGMNWVKENFKPNNCVYVEGLDRFKQLCLMSLCDHNIIANSSFPWWAAYLNTNKDKKVICPYNYLNDSRFPGINGEYFPKEWISLHTY
jgi:hypothetical protein